MPVLVPSAGARAFAGVWVAGLGLTACVGGAGESSPPPAALAGSWLGEVAADPAAFEAAVADDREAWVALHAGDLKAAAAGEGVAAARATRELAWTYDRVGRLSGRAWVQLADTWEGRTGVPEGSVLPLLAAFAAEDIGDTVGLARWSAAVEAHPTLAAVAHEARSDGPGAAHPVAERRRQHRAWRQTAEVGPELEVAGRPLWTEAGGTRSFHDPLVAGSLAASWATASTAEAVEPTLAALLFSGCPTRPGDCAADPVWAASGVTWELGPADDPEAARASLRALDQALDAWRASLDATAPPEGRAVVDELRLAGVLRSRLLVGVAAAALEDARPHQALLMATLARDLQQPRTIGPLNPPALFVVLAEANLRTGRTREALDALQVLAEAWPELVGVDEIVGDLAVLEGLDRQGDSKEN